MTTRSIKDEYGFIRSNSFDYTEQEAFMNKYLRVLTIRAQKWEKITRKGYNKMASGAKLKRYIQKGIPGSYLISTYLPK